MTVAVVNNQPAPKPTVVEEMNNARDVLLESEYEAKKNNARENQRHDKFSKNNNMHVPSEKQCDWSAANHGVGSYVSTLLVFVESFTFLITGLGLSRKVSHRWFHVSCKTK